MIISSSIIIIIIIDLIVFNIVIIITIEGHFATQNCIRDFWGITFFTGIPVSADRFVRDFRIPRDFQSFKRRLKSLNHHKSLKN